MECKNLIGTYICICGPGYQRRPDGESCVGKKNLWGRSFDCWQWHRTMALNPYGRCVLLGQSHFPSCYDFLWWSPCLLIIYEFHEHCHSLRTGLRVFSQPLLLPGLELQMFSLCASFTFFYSTVVVGSVFSTTLECLPIDLALLLAPWHWVLMPGPCEWRTPLNQLDLPPENLVLSRVGLGSGILF